MRVKERVNNICYITGCATGAFSVRCPGRRGMIYPVILLAIIMVVMFAYVFDQYRQQRVMVTTHIERRENAVAIAEAGLAAAIAEINYQPDWITHRIDGSPGASTWGAPVTHRNQVGTAGVLKQISGTTGTYCGRIGDYGEFRVRAGLEKTHDNPATKAIDESRAFYRIESIGRYLDTYVKVKALLKVSYITDEFLIFDCDFLDMILGVNHPNEGKNYFTIGSLYGKRWVDLGTIPSGSPRLVMNDISNIESFGEIKVRDSGVTLNSRGMGPNNSTMLGPGQVNPDFDTFDGCLKDMFHGGADLDLASRIPYDYYYARAASGGIIIDAVNQYGKPDPDFINPYPEIQHVQGLKYIDFGTIDDRDVGLIPGGADQNFNYFVYSKTPIRIHGNPDRDIIILCDEDIYISGDFNQSPELIQNYKNGTDFIEYAPNPLTGRDYWAEERDFRIANMGTPDANKGKYKVRAYVISRKKVWYDYTRPELCFENELKPLIEYEVAKLLYGNGLNGSDDTPQATKAYTEVACDLAGQNIMRDGVIRATKVNDLTLDQFVARPEIQALQSYFSTRPNYTGNRQYVPNYRGLYISSLADQPGQTTRIKEFVTRQLSIPGGGQRSIYDMCRNSGQITAAERKAIVDEIWKELVACARTDDMDSPLWDIPQRLYELTRPPSSAHAPGKYDNTQVSNWNDRLVIPEVTINAKVISSDKRNGLWVQGRSVDKIFNELGNPKPEWQPPRTAKYYRYMEPVSGIFRLCGCEIFLREKVVPPVMNGSVYQPHLRKKVFDTSLIGFEDPYALKAFTLIDWKAFNVSKEEFDSF